MKRKVYDTLLKWKNEDKGRVALMVEGARRIGKSYIVKEFAQNEYKSYILLDFSNIRDNIKPLFEKYLTNLDVFFMYLQSITGVELFERNSLIVFDEVQFYPKARAAIKHLVADGRYDYIETGSLVSIRKNVKDILIPSEERSVKMFPMDFEEFLWALGDKMTMPFIKTCYEKLIPLGPMHDKAMDYFRQYMVVGGMPQAVLEFVETKNLAKVDVVKRDILNLYRNDIKKYAEELSDKVTNIWDTLPSQLQKHEKKFKLSALQDEARFRSYETSFFWLKEADVVNICYGASEPSIGLEMKLDDSTLKLYMGDTGLLISHAFSESQIMSEELYQRILLGKIEFNEGMLMENIVAQMLKASGHKLYFYSKYSKTNAEDTMEIDFLIAKPNLKFRHNISPIEVKSGVRYTLKSLKKFYDKYKAQLSTPYVLHSKDLKQENGIVYLPLYMTGLL